MARSVSYNKRLIRHLKNPVEAAAYLNAVLADGGAKKGSRSRFLKAMAKVAKVQPEVRDKP